VGVHRYAFPKGTDAKVLLDMRTSMYDYPGKVLWSRVRVRADGTVTGFRETRGWAPGRQLYFAMRFSRPLAGHELHNTEQDIVYKGFPPPGEKDPAQRAQIEGRQLVGTFNFGKLDAPLVVKVAISPVSEAGAIANLDAEVADFDFDRVRAQAKQDWTQALSVLDIDAPEHARRSAYTALYHTMLGPTLFMDADGQYRGSDNAVHKAEGFTHYSTFSLWDTYRALHPLLTLVQPEKRNSDFVNSMLAHHAQPYGMLPVWSFHGLEDWCMIGYHAVPVIADAYVKGIRGFDADKALKAMVETANYGPYDGIAQYRELGYVPIDEEGEAASKTLEYAFDDWTIARMAQAMGKADIAATFDKRAGNWRNAFDKDTGFMRASAMAASARRSTPAPAATAPTTPRATPGSTRGTCRRTWPAWRQRTVAATSCSRAWTRCSTPRWIRRSSSTWKTSPA
jgi:predicted alpha-1,2-mannosidase